MFLSAYCSRSSCCWRLRSLCLNRTMICGAGNRIRLRGAAERSRAASRFLHALRKHRPVLPVVCVYLKFGPLAFTLENVGSVRNCTDSRRRVTAICEDEKERTHAQAVILRALSYLWCRYQEDLCAEFRCSPLKTSRRPEVRRY